MRDRLNWYLLLAIIGAAVVLAWREYGPGNA